uniref:Reverse transcriptase domain-containing protein n=1 Tax=Tanacetum cinerariifolium TaxID=118510 RepID=A0A6L2MUQ7_TANCI|nr:reverse transcriptase domain-containing protein [Tanacetum cinerariifolium]
MHEKSDFHWTAKAEEAFKKMKLLITELPMLAVPMEKEELIVYLSAKKRRALRGSKINYTSMEKLVLALVLSKPKVAGRLQKWSIELRENAIHYRPRLSVKGKILADFIVERPEEDSLDTLMEVEEELPEPWILFTNGSSCTNEYEALITELRVVEQMVVKNLQANVDSRLVANQLSKKVLVEELKEKLTSEVEILAVVEKEGDTWMTPIFEYLTEETLPTDVKKARAGINIAGPFLEGPGKVKFLIEAIDYFTKWIEAKPVATITGNQIKKFVWENIVRRFRLLGEIIADNEK